MKVGNRLKGLKRQSVYLVIMSFLVLGVLTSFALVSYDISLFGAKENTINSCSLDLNFTDTNPIKLLTGVPIDDSVALTYDPYTFSVTNNGSGTCTNVTFNLKMSDICLSCGKDVCSVNDGRYVCKCRDGEKIDSSFIKYQVVNKNSNEVFTGSDPYLNLVIPGDFSNNNTVSYEVRIWISNAATNKDLYISNGNGGYVTNADGSFAVRNFCSKLNLEVSAD